LTGSALQRIEYLNGRRLDGTSPVLQAATQCPDGKLPRTQAQQQRDYLEAKEDSKAGDGDGSPQWIVKM